jgi:hypothetical protein
VWSDGVAIILPDRHSLAHMGERREQRLVEQLVTQAAVEALSEGNMIECCDWQRPLAANC